MVKYLWGEEMQNTVIQIEVIIIKEEFFAHSLAKRHWSRHGAYRDPEARILSCNSL